MKHTPGPWTLHRDLEDKCSSIDTPMHEVIVGPCSIDDARLIAAAPDLLDAVRTVAIDLYITNRSPLEQAKVLNALWHLCQKALAKAEGES